MTTKRKKSDAMRFMESITGGPLTFSSLIESTRLCEELSQAAFAKKLGISKSHLCDIEKGRKFVSAARAAKFARTLGYSEEQWLSLALQAIVDEAGLKYQVHVEAA